VDIISYSTYSAAARVQQTCFSGNHAFAAEGKTNSFLHFQISARQNELIFLRLICRCAAAALVSAAALILGAAAPHLFLPPPSNQLFFPNRSPASPA
jgi:hypothetical protein